MLLDEKKMKKSDTMSVLIMILSVVCAGFCALILMDNISGDTEDRAGIITAHIGYISAFAFLFIRSYRSYKIVQPLKQIALYITDSGKEEITLADISEYAIEMPPEKVKVIFNKASGKGFIKNAYVCKNSVVISKSGGNKPEYFSQGSISVSNVISIVVMVISAIVTLFLWATVAMALTGGGDFISLEEDVVPLIIIGAVFAIFLLFFVFGYKRYLLLKCVRKLAVFIEYSKKETTAQVLADFMEMPKKKVKKIFEKSAAKGYFKNTYLKYENEFTIVKVKQEKNK